MKPQYPSHPLHPPKFRDIVKVLHVCSSSPSKTTAVLDGVPSLFIYFFFPDLGFELLFMMQHLAQEPSTSCLTHTRTGATFIDGPCSAKRQEKN
jgi:hypothetical protein